MKTIIEDLEELEKASDGMLGEIMGGLLDEYQSV